MNWKAFHKLPSFPSRTLLMNMHPQGKNGSSIQWVCLHSSCSSGNNFFYIKLFLSRWINVCTFMCWWQKGSFFVYEKIKLMCNACRWFIESSLNNRKVFFHTISEGCNLICGKMFAFAFWVKGKCCEIFE